MEEVAGSLACPKPVSFPQCVQLTKWFGAISSAQLSHVLGIYSPGFYSDLNWLLGTKYELWQHHT